MPEKQVDVIEFARQVEDMCDRILDAFHGLSRNDQIKIKKIREKAADLQFINYVHGGSDETGSSSN